MIRAQMWAIWAAVAAASFSLTVPVARGNDFPRWDYWGVLPSEPEFMGYLASRPNQVTRIKQQFDVIDVFDLKESSRHPNKLYCGSVLMEPEFPSVSSNAAVQAAFQFAIAKIKERSRGKISSFIKLTHAVVVPLHITGDNGGSQMIIQQRFLDSRGQPQGMKSHVTFGFNFYLTLEDDTMDRKHRVVVALDREHEYNLFQHTYGPLTASEGSDEVVETTCDADGRCSARPASPAKPRILSFNVWSTNPSADVYGYERRWFQYEKRIDHLASFVREADAAIIGFQEVRYDGTFGGIGNHAQIQHLVKRLPGYQYVYQPAMSYLNSNDPYERIEEGPAILSKHPIVSTDYLLLSRSPNDPNDAHQRLCLHAVVDAPQWGHIDVYVTHLSLSEHSREQTMIEIWKYMQKGKGKTQVLLGDLNAEPQSRGIQFLQGLGELHGERTDLRDAWLEKHEEATPRSLSGDDRYHRFTFPSDNPVKRIDFILYRGQGVVRECEIIGQEPTEDTASYPQDVGMLDADSPIYASDHRGVVVEFGASSEH
ncbi:TPA: hypothetical protein N0F65_002077 [Lagenidium giganteum]|uniref:Endonuclease/exonuclease/phosphatase domain-containing protein n=1 Tax=Lagenidium giganteum TaxID=4803 RepID=A0AAV2ZEC8_9STRA|nr:TPA: hypothetical protein N0F65_002077 [Lagenidium giganteum]